jgi:hypothetical protein
VDNFYPIRSFNCLLIHRNLMKNVILTLPIAILAIAAFSSCMTPYRAADSFLSQGYSEMPVDSITYLVTFTGNTTLELENRYTLYRSAELTLQKGYDHFLFMDNWHEGDIKMIRMFRGSGDMANSYDAKAIMTTMAPQIKQ